MKYCMYYHIKLSDTETPVYQLTEPVEPIVIPVVEQVIVEPIVEQVGVEPTNEVTVVLEPIVVQIAEPVTLEDIIPEPTIEPVEPVVSPPSSPLTLFSEIYPDLSEFDSGFDL